MIDYGIGNLRSAQKALVRQGADAVLTDDPTEIAAADAVVLPGVGNLGACLGALRSRGLEQATLDAVESGRPFLGICVGMQMLYDGSDEAPGVKGLGVFSGSLRRLPSTLVTVPQMQWNRLELRRADHPLFDGIADGEWMYFVHSYAAYGDEAGADEVLAVCDYAGPVVAVVGRGTVMATQFHPEKSSLAGLRLLSNFVRMAERVAA